LLVLSGKVNNTSAISRISRTVAENRFEPDASLYAQEGGFL
jgi:hypothetical protein